ncbi:MAG: MBL fold metallo-hydrolase [Solirubrobacterales bacterium]|nr:MBL fold metallo-hydrolase [Solirubrobacterales bacterium]
MGKSPAWQDADGACSGYLIEEGGATLLLDCGNGVFGKLRRYHDYVDVDAIVISHLHADHFFDLVPYAFALIHAPRQQPVPVDRWPGTDSPARPKLYGPPGSPGVFRRLAALWGLESLVDDAFDIHEYGPGSLVLVNGIEIAFREVPHYIQTHAVGLTGPDGQRITYGADCSPNQNLIDFASETDLLVAEATLPRPERTGVRGHLTPAEAGEHAEAAGAKGLLLTHFSDELDAEWVAGQAKQQFSGPSRLAAEGLELTI